MKCPVCEGKLENKTVSYSVHGEELGRFPASVCKSCSEQWFDEETAKNIEKLEKDKGLFGMTRTGKIGYSGNSLIIRIPAKIAKYMNLRKEEPISIYPESKDRLVVEF
ncbi:MAG: YgiT-type zinc finger protein [archaeon]